MYMHTSAHIHIHKCVYLHTHIYIPNKASTSVESIAFLVNPVSENKREISLNTNKAQLSIIRFPHYIN